MSSFNRWFLVCLFELIRSALVDPETCPWVCHKSSLGRIQTGHTYLLPTQVCGRLSREFRLGVQTCLHQFIAFLDLNVLCNICLRLILLIVYMCVFHSLYHRILIMKPFLGCARKLYVVYIQTRHTALLTPQVCGRLWRGCQFCDFTCFNQLINFIQVNISEFIKFIAHCIITIS